MAPPKPSLSYKLAHMLASVSEFIAEISSKKEEIDEQIESLILARHLMQSIVYFKQRRYLLAFDELKDAEPKPTGNRKLDKITTDINTE